MDPTEPTIGSIQYFAPGEVPRGYLQCQGQLLSIAQNAALFSILGTSYGGDGMITFALPNLPPRQADGGNEVHAFIAIQGIYPQPPQGG